jgi:hypothetical protein
LGIGFEGLALFDDSPFLCTSMSAPDVLVRLDSSGAFEGNIETDNPTSGIATPHVYDYSTNDGSFSFDLTPDFFSILKDWIYQRGNYAKLEFYPNKGAYERFDSCFWTGMNFNAAEGSLVNGTCNIMIPYRDETTFGGDYINNRTGLSQDFGIFNTSSSPYQLNPSGSNTQPLPFWKTRMDSTLLLPNDNVNLISWNLDFNQPANKYFTCQSLSSPQPPSFIGIGVMTVTLQIELFINTASYTLPNTINALKVYLGDNYFDFNVVEKQHYNQDLKSPNEITSVSATYQIFGFTGQ